MDFSIETIIFGMMVLVLLWLVFDLRTKLGTSQRDKKEIGKELEKFDRRVSEQMHQTSQNLVSQIGSFQETFDRRLQDNTHKLDSRLDNAAKAYTQIRESLVEVQKSSEQIFDISKDITSLQDILLSPKARGGFGEIIMQDLIAKWLPKEHYAFQHTFRSGDIVDAIVKFSEGIVSVDAKFPLPNFRRMVEATDDAEKNKHRRAFYSDVKKHVDAIADKYIRTDEGTLDFALMYIPAENVYYEAVIEHSDENMLLDYFSKRRVIPVSPNSFYAYLRTIKIGLDRAHVGQKAKETLGMLDRLVQEQGKFYKDFEVLGAHLSNAQKKFDDADRRYEKVQGQMNKLTTFSHKEDEEEKLQEQQKKIQDNTIA